MDGLKASLRLDPTCAALAAGVVALFLLAGPAAAQDLSPIATFFTTIGTALTGPVGRALGLVAIAAVGISMIALNFNWGMVISVLIGLVVLFGAATILAGFA